MDIKLHTKKFGEIFYKIDEDDLHIIQNHKIYACKLKNDKLYLIRDDKQWLHRLIMKDCPKGMVIDHVNGDTLDNRKTNLRITTYSQNGTNTNKTRFNENDIIDILISNLSNNKLAKKYKVSNCLIGCIRTGILYSHYAPNIKRCKSIKKLSADIIKSILLSSSSYKELMDKYNLPRTTIYNIKTGKSYKNIYPELPRIKYINGIKTNYRLEPI